MSKIILITGGARSGKSRFAESLLKDMTDVTYIATAIVTDDEMEERIRLHRQSRPSEWKTTEAYRDIASKLDKSEGYLLDCVTVMTSNIMFELTAEYEKIPPEVQREVEETVKKELLALSARARETGALLVLVTNEVGDSIVPMHHVSRVYRDIVGRVNQYAASLADEVYLTVCGIPMRVK
ncbi:MAG: bifunctional adenosylcobinamide kinase/adenosylcobinamide-phosphate guanylyltransferase [Clostridiales bacterium]|nr:bifunctional adenosylcobinamide kinase/adenosylcobinamide-phosphate guanylyltransferase [Clostridiales bacterium]